MEAMSVLEFREKMYRSIDLRNRWDGLRLRQLALGVDDAINAASPSIADKAEAMTDFPKPYWHIFTKFDEQGEEITGCVPCESLFLKDGEYTRPYTVKKKENSKGNRYSFKRILFKKSDILAYETRHTDEDGSFLFDEESDSVEIVLPKELWAGRSPRHIRGVMSEQGYDLWVIAHVLYTWCGLTNMTELGKVLNPTGSELGDSAYAKQARKLLEKAESADIFYE